VIEIEEIEDVARRRQITRAEAEEMLRAEDVAKADAVVRMGALAPSNAAPSTITINVDAYFTAPPTMPINCRCIATLTYTDEHGNRISHTGELA